MMILLIAFCYASRITFKIFKQVRDFFNRSIVYTDANCTITFYYDNGNIWKTENMTLIGRFYVYTLTPTEEGTYYYEINCVRPDGNYGGVAGVLYVKKSLYDKAFTDNGKG